jgi:hypothetical protein
MFPSNMNTQITKQDMEILITLQRACNNKNQQLFLNPEMKISKKLALPVFIEKSIY